MVVIGVAALVRDP